MTKKSVEGKKTRKLTLKKATLKDLTSEGSRVKGGAMTGACAVAVKTSLCKGYKGI